MKETLNLMNFLTLTKSNPQTQHTMKIHKQTKLVKTEKQEEGAFIVAACIAIASILLIVTVIAENL
jgi:hypothetical protein